MFDYDNTATYDALKGFEKHNTDKAKLHAEICDKLHSVYIAKNHDYGDSFGETFKTLGIISAVTRIADKTNRLQNLCTKGNKVNESIEDTLMDLANYAIMTLIELRA